MKTIKRVSLGSALIFMSLTGACDRQESSKLDIVRGRPLAPDSPALNSVVGLSQDGWDTFCTGSVVADDIVVTAAHCVKNQKDFYVVFGQPNTVMHKIAVEKVETYKPYADAAFPNFDIAWLKLKTKVPERWKPMEILRDPSLLKEASEFRLAGYGHEKTNCREASCNDELLEANTKLDKYYDTPRLMSLLVFKGAAELGLGGACNGDSGGPAYAKIKDRWYLIGVTNGTTAYVNPQSFVDPTKSCEAGDAIYTFMGDYVPWLEKRSSQDLTQLPESNPDRSEPAFVVKGEQRAADVAEPQTWAEWLQYPYHNEEVWNTVERLIWDVWAKQRPLLKDDEHVKLWVDSEFSTAKVQEITSYEVKLNALDELRYEDQPVDMRPLSSWTALQDLTLVGEAATLGIDAASRLPALRSMLLNPGTSRPRGAINLSALQNLGPSLNFLTMLDFKPAELKTLPSGDLKQLQYLSFSAQSGAEEAELDLSGMISLQQLRISSWAYTSRISLPQGLALQRLELKLDQTTDLKWLDVEALKSIKWLEFGSEVLSDAAILSRFQNKAVQKLVAPGSRLKSEDLPAAGFADLQELSLNGNLFSSTAFMKDLPTLKKADMRDNPLVDTDCPSGVSCSFDRIFNPKTVADFCRNTTMSQDYAYTPIIKMLLNSQGLSSRFYSDRSCDLLQQSLDDATSLELNGDQTWYLPNGLNYDMRVLKGLNGLKNLKIRNVTLANADALAELASLKTLDLGAVKTKGLGFISKMPSLENLNYMEFPHSNLESLSHPKLKVLMLASEGPRVVLDGGRVQTIGVNTALPALNKLSLRGNPLRDLKGIENLKALSELDITETRVSDLSPLNALIGATVFFGNNYELDTCPILYGNCQTGSKKLDGATFGSDLFSLQGSKWSMGQTIPGLGKALRN